MGARVVDMLDQTAAPLYEGLAAYQAGGMTGFHTPGHTSGRAFDLSGLTRLDLTEIPIKPGGPLTLGLVRQAEALAADFFGAACSRFLSNGASIGVMTMILGACPPGGGIIIARDCHRSAVNACIIGDLRPQFIPSLFSPDWHFPLGMDPIKTTAFLSGDTPVLITNPTYQGVHWDLRPLAAPGGRLLVDEAHGAHLVFGDNQQGARAAGAAAWVHGCHKTLGSLTQTGILHLRAGVDAKPFVRWLERLESTSPSYPLLSSLDLARQWAALYGQGLWTQAAARLASVRARLRSAGLRILDTADLPPGASLDPAKLTVRTPDGGLITARKLQELYGLQAEAAGPDWITFLITPFHTDAELNSLCFALLALLSGVPHGQAETIRPRLHPERILWPREAALAPKREFPLCTAKNLVAAEPLCPYPPGIPLVWPGERISPEMIDYLEDFTASGGLVQGIDSAGEVSVADV